MIRRLFAALVLTCACGTANVALPPSPQLANPAFDAGPAGRNVPGWTARGEKYGQAEVVSEPVVSAPGALKLVARGPGSSGDDSFMIFQVLDVAAYRGRRVRFGAKVWTNGGASNITLYTPQKFANDFFTELQSGRFVAREASLDVPQDASFLSFGIQVFGPSGATIVIDDAFVSADGGKGGPAPGAPRGSGPTTSTAQATTGTARVAIDATRVERQVSPLLFGMHIEWAGNGNGLADPRGGLRQDVLRELVPLHIPVFRFPGGILADYYDWTAAAEPRARRQKAVNVFTNKSEAQTFGLEEFGALLEATGAKALITANYGTGSPEQAGAFARKLAERRISAPYWEVGNEIYLADPDGNQPNGRRIFHAPAQYAADFDRYRSAIRAALPDAMVGAIGHIDSGAFPLAVASIRDWSAEMLQALETPVDFLAVHNAYAPVIIDDSVDFSNEGQRTRVYRAMYGSVRQTQENLRDTRTLLAKSRRAGLPIAVTEFGPLFGVSGKRDVHAAYVDQSRTMAAALYTASLLDLFIGDPSVFMATYTNVVHKWYGSLLTDTDQGLVKTPTYHLYALYRSRFEPGLVPVTVTSPTFDAPTVGIARGQNGVPDLLARASVAAGGNRLTAMLVNRSTERALTTTVTTGGFTAARVDCQLLAAPSPNAVNGISLTATTAGGTPIAPRPMTCTAGATMTLTIPPNSVVSLVADR